MSSTAVHVLAMELSLPVAVALQRLQDQRNSLGRRRPEEIMRDAPDSLVALEAVHLLRAPVPERHRALPP